MPSQYHFQENFSVSGFPGRQPKQTKRDFKKVHLLDYVNGYSISKPLDNRTKAPLVSLSLPPDPFFPIVKRPHPREHARQFYQSIKTNPATDKDNAPHPHQGVVLRFKLTRINDYQPNEKLIIDKQASASLLMLQYFLEDNTMLITSLVKSNWVIIFTRQRIPKAFDDPSAGYLELEDILGSKELNVYGSLFAIEGSDEYSKSYIRDKLKLSNFDIAVAHKELPAEYHAPQSSQDANPRHQQEVIEKLSKLQDMQRFLGEAAPSVLRFFATWTDRTIPNYVWDRKFEIRIYIADNSFEILEDSNQGVGSRLFLRRQQLPKKIESLSSFKGCTAIGTSFDAVKSTADSFYCWKDLKLNENINVLGRDFHIDGFDKFTADFISTNSNL